MNFFINIAFFLAFVLAGCGGGGSQQQQESKNSLQSAFFIDSNVSGVEYSTNEDRNVTGENGIFFYKEGQLVSFFIGGIKLGDLNSSFIRESKKVFPTDLFTGEERDKKALYVARLLQSLDKDNNPSNGIEIEQSVRQELKDFVADFSGNIKEETLKEILKRVGKEVVEKESALEHFNTSLIAEKLPPITNTKEDTKEKINHLPQATFSSFTTQEDLSFLGKLTAEDSDEDPLSFALTTAPKKGVVTIEKSGNFVYTPKKDYNGVDSFEYKVSDSIAEIKKSVSIMITPVNDTPTAENFTYSNIGSQTKTFNWKELSKAKDVDGDTLQAKILTKPRKGVAIIGAERLTFYPDGTSSGDDSLTIAIYDSKDEKVVISITLKGLTYKPISTPTPTPTPTNHRPVATFSSFSVAPNTTFTGTLTGTDSDGDTLSFIKVSNPSHGNVTINSSGSFSYAPDTNYTGSDSFVYKVNDSKLDSSNKTVSIVVNSKPVATFSSFSVNEDTNYTGTLTGTDSDGDTLSFIKVSDPSHGSITIDNNGSFSYIPNSDYNGSDNFIYKVNDSKTDSLQKSVAITVVNINDVPTANDINYTTPIGVTAKTFNWRSLSSANDADGDALTGSVKTPPTKGSVVVSGDSLTFTPNGSSSGEDSLIFTISDSHTAEVDINITLNTIETNLSVESTLPSNNKELVVWLDLNVSFNNTLDCGTLDTTTFLLKDESNTTVAGSISCNQKRGVFNPSSDLAPNKTYTAVLKDSIHSVGGSTLQQDYHWSIKTVAPLLKTGQTHSYTQDDDGEYQKGEARSYTRNANETVTDNITKLMWQDNNESNSITKTFTTASFYCSALNLGGYNDWRVPTLEELETLIDYRRQPTIDTTFQYRRSSNYWSCTTYHGNSSNGWNVHMVNGFSYDYSKSSSYYVRCVRGGQ